jgi:plasmid stabilization system protein ParE
VTRIRWTTEAADQLDAIVNHIREDNPEAAFALAQSILDRIAGLEKFPGLGRPGEQKGTRELVSPPYVIVCRLKEDVAEILHIWHGALAQGSCATN